MKKFLAILLAVVLCLSLAACAGSGDKDTTTGNEADTTSAEKVDVSKLKVGVVLLHDENSGYDRNFIEAVEKACDTLGIDKETNLVFKKGIPETSECYDACVELVEDKCNIVFADSFGHEEHVIKAAKEFPDVQFFHATGTSAKLENLPNFHNAFASIYEGRYLAGVVAGMKLNELIKNKTIKEDEAKIGYISAMEYAECISGYTSFFLGARSVCPSATMTVTYTNSWADDAKEQEAANLLIEKGCVIISEHADTHGSPNACENAAKAGKTVFHVGYNVDFSKDAPTANLVSSKIDWTPYFEHIFTQVAKGEEVKADYCGTVATGSVILTDLTEANVAEGTKEKVEEVKKGLADGSIKVYDVKTFTVTPDRAENKFVKCEVDADGHLTSFTADAIADEAYTPDTEVVKDGVVCESTERSAPYFNIIIDGIDFIKK